MLVHACVSVCPSEAMRQRNQAMKDRFEELSVWREKLREEREFYETKFKEARHCLAAKCDENDTLKKQLQTLEGRKEGATNVSKTRGGRGCMLHTYRKTELVGQPFLSNVHFVLFTSKTTRLQFIVKRQHVDNNIM